MLLKYFNGRWRHFRNVSRRPRLVLACGHIAGQPLISHSPSGGRIVRNNPLAMMWSVLLHQTRDFSVV